MIVIALALPTLCTSKWDWASHSTAGQGGGGVTALLRFWMTSTETLLCGCNMLGGDTQERCARTDLIPVKLRERKLNGLGNELSLFNFIHFPLTDFKVYI